MEPNADLERLLESALGPLEPPERVRRAVVGASSRGRGAVLLALSYAAGVLTVLGALHLEKGASRPTSAPPAPPPLSFESIADRVPAPPPEPVVAAPVRPDPVPRIS